MALPAECRAALRAFAPRLLLGGMSNGPYDEMKKYPERVLEAEIAFHKWVELVEVGWLREEITYDDYLADFSAPFHDIRRDAGFAACLAPDSYLASQELAGRLLEAGSLGLVYPSVRRRRGSCLACFRPPLVTNLRKDATYLFRWDGVPTPTVSVAGV